MILLYEIVRNRHKPVSENKPSLLRWLARGENVPIVFYALCIAFSTGCGTCPDLSYRGTLKPEDMAFIRERVAEKKIDLNDAKSFKGDLASSFTFVPLYLGGRGIGISEDPETKERVYTYGEIVMSGFPVTVWLAFTNRKISMTGEERQHVDSKGLLAGILGSWGEFHFESQKRIPEKIGGTGIQTGLGILPAAIYPSRWFFTGTKGSYWNAPMYLFGHVSSDTSGTFHLLSGLIPIRYDNREKAGSSE